MISIRGGSGLGDSLYLQAVARHLVVGHQVEVCSNFPDVFSQLPVKVSPFRRERINRLAHYSARKGVKGTTQFQDCCTAAQVPLVELKLDWKPTSAIGERLKEQGKPIVCVQLPRAPMGRSDGFGADLLPDCRRIQQAIDILAGRAFVVQIGAGKGLWRFEGVNVDLSNRTTVAELIDVAYASTAFLGYVSFIVPLAESLDKKVLCIWSRKGLNSGHLYVRQITPEKVLHKPSSQALLDNCGESALKECTDALLQP